MIRNRFGRVEGQLAVEPRAAAPSDEILTVREAQELLKIGRTKLWELTKQHQISAYRVGPGRNGNLRYKRSELLEWLESNRL